MPTDDDKPTATEAKPDADKNRSAEAAAVADVRDKVNATATKWLTERFGFFTDSEGTLHLPDQAAGNDLQRRAEQFMKGFARAVAETAPVAPSEARKPEEVPDAAQAVGRFLSKMGGAVSDALQDYLRRNASDPQHPERPVVIDGRFIQQHGVSVLTTLVQSLGSAFDEPRSVATAAAEPAPREKVQVEFELPKLLKQLAQDFAARPNPSPAATPPAADPSEPKKDGP